MVLLSLFQQNANLENSEQYESISTFMTPNEFLMLVVLLSPGLVLSIIIMVTFAEGG